MGVTGDTYIGQAGVGGTIGRDGLYGPDQLLRDLQGRDAPVAIAVCQVGETGQGPHAHQGGQESQRSGVPGRL